MTYNAPAEILVHDVFVVKLEHDEAQHGWECATCGASGRHATRVDAVVAAYQHKRTASDTVRAPDSALDIFALAEDRS